MRRRDFAKTMFGAALAPLVLGRTAATTLFSSSPHPVFKPEITSAGAASLRARLNTLLAMDEPALLALVPAQTGFSSCDCPNCEQGSQGQQLQWSIEQPDTLTCRYCGHQYPSRKYPDDKVLEVKDPLGRVQRYRYYQDKTGLKYFFEARRWRLVRDYLADTAYDLAQIYYFSREARVARRAALILDRFAELYPGFLVVRESEQADQGFQEHPPYDRQGGKWGRWYYDEMPTYPILAYDLVYNSGELEKLSHERGLEVKQRIEQDFFRAAVRHVRSYSENYSNASPSIYWGLAVLGRVIAEPDYVHDAVRRITGIFENSFLFDGFWKEGSVNYHRMTLRGLEAPIGAVEHYSDPAGYTDSTDHARFDDLRLAQSVPMLPRAVRVTDRFCYPDGRPLPVHDAWVPSPRPSEATRDNPADQPYRSQGKPLESSAPALWPALGHAYLGRGKGAHQMQAHLHFSGAYGHAHNDNLHLALFACGEELLPDLGYSHTRYRYWTRSTLAHNTVVVDGHEQYSGSLGQQYTGPGISYPQVSKDQFTDGNLLRFQAAGEDFQAIEAAGERGYPGLATTYRRMLLMIGVDEKRAYVVDLFRVTGGQRHEWVLHGSADRDQELRVEAALSDYAERLLPPGTTFEPPQREYQTGTAGSVNPAYGFVRDVRRGAAPRVLVATFAPATIGASLRVHCLPPAGAEVLTGRAPSVRRAEENDARVDEFSMPMLLLRNAGATSTFAAVMEPFRSQPVIERVERMAVPGGGEVLKISATGWTDYLMYRNSEAEGEQMGGPLRVLGRLGWARVVEGKAVAMCLVDGREMSCGDQKLSSAGSFEGRVFGVQRKAAGARMDALVVEDRFPSHIDLAGQTVIVRHRSNDTTHGYLLTGFRREDGRTLLLLADEPGFEMNGSESRFLFFPKRVIEGEVSYSIPSLNFVRT